MLIKVRSNFYINTDAVTSISTDLNGDALLRLRDGSSHKITAAAADGLLEFMEVNESLLLEDEPPAPATLTTRLAQALRDTWKGASLAQLNAVFPDAGIPALKLAIANLEAENVVLGIMVEGQTLYYHTASNEAQTHLQTKRLIHYYGALDCPGVRKLGLSTTIPGDVTCAYCLNSMCPYCLNSITPNPDPLDAGATLPDASLDPAEHSAQIVDPKTQS